MTLDGSKIDPHLISTRNSLLLHHRYADMIDEDPGVLEAARKLIDELVDTGESTLGDRLWKQLFRESWRHIRRRMLEPGSCGNLMRSSSPFAFVTIPMPEEARRQLWRQAKAQLIAEGAVRGLYDGRA